jgi:hypothetical protein
MLQLSPDKYGDPYDLLLKLRPNCIVMQIFYIEESDHPIPPFFEEDTEIGNFTDLRLHVFMLFLFFFFSFVTTSFKKHRFQ